MDTSTRGYTSNNRKVDDYQKYIKLHKERNSMSSQSKIRKNVYNVHNSEYYVCNSRK